jgi:hypothetical protein
MPAAEAAPVGDATAGSAAPGHPATAKDSSDIVGCPCCINVIGMVTEDARIVLRGDQAGELDDPIVDHPGQPADYVHTDGTVWTWQDRWRIVAGVRLRLYDLATCSADSA